MMMMIHFLVCLLSSHAQYRKIIIFYIKNIKDLIDLDQENKKNWHEPKYFENNRFKENQIKPIKLTDRHDTPLYLDLDLGIVIIAWNGMNELYFGTLKLNLLVNGWTKPMKTTKTNSNNYGQVYCIFNTTTTHF